MFDKDITVVNSWYNSQTHKNEYKIHHLKGFWSSNEGISISNTQIVKNDGLIARILISEKGYVEPKDYLGENGTWTLKNDDYLIKGIVDNVTSISSIKDNYECMKIVDVSKKDYGSVDMQHFAIKGE